MKRRLAEETVIFISVVKWVILAIIVGAIVGLSTTGFLMALSWGTEFRGTYSGFLFHHSSYF